MGEAKRAPAPGPTLVIVGGVAAGMSAAAKARRCHEEARIVVFEKGPAVSYANCGLPYYLGGVIRRREDLLVTDPEFLWQRFRIEAKVGHEVVDIDPAGRTVKVRDLAGGRTFCQPYDKLVLAPGAEAVVPPIPGRELPFVFTLKTLADTDRLAAFLAEQQPRRAVVVGGGLIGVEAAENLVHRGIEVAMVEFLDRPLAFLDGEMAAVVAAHLQAKGVALHLGERVVAVEEEGGVRLASGRRLETDLVIMAVGVRPNLELARKAGLVIGDAGGVLVDEYMQTSDPHILAAGDCVEKTLVVTGKRQLLPMAAAANKEGRAAGANAMGRRIAVRPYAGTVIVKVFDLAVAATGLAEEAALREGFSPVVSYVLEGHHAGYYPGAKLLRLKLVADQQSGRLLGAQAVGEAGVDKRIDVVACAIANHMRAEDLLDLDLAYAPPFGLARDPVIVAGMQFQNAMRGEWQPVSPRWLADRLASGAVEKDKDLQLLDVRTAAEVRRTGVLHKSARHIPVDELRHRLAELAPDRETVVYCAVGLRSYVAARILAQRGFTNVKVLAGGILSWPHALVR